MDQAQAERLHSALPDAEARAYGPGTRGVDPGSIFDDIGPDPSHPDTAPVTRTTVTPMTPAPSATPQPTDPTLTPAVTPQSDAAAPEAAAPTTTETSVTPPGTATAEEVEVEESELTYLREIATSKPDALIAKMLSYRKGNSTLQSRIDKVKAVFGQDIIAAVERGEVPDITGRLLTDLRDETFEHYVADFYSSHELKDGRYVRTRALAPAPDLLAEYAKLTLEKASLNMGAFLPDGEEFDATEAMTNRLSPSGQALSKMQLREREIDQRLGEITSLSGQSTSGTQIPPEEVARAKQVAIDSLTSAHPELKDASQFDRFRTFVAEHQANPLEIYYQAYSSAQAKNARTQRLAVIELETVRKNLSAPGTPGGATPSGPHSPNGVDPTQADLVKADADYFGDPLN